MDLATGVALITILVVLYHVLGPAALPGIPGPSLREYLPGGLVYKIYTDPASASQTVRKMVRVYGDVFQMLVGPTRTVFCAHPADIVHIASSSDDFDRPPSMITALDSIMPRSVFSMARDEHFAARRSLRDSFNHALLPDFQRPMRNAVAEIVAELRDDARAQRQTTTGKTPVDLNNIVATATTRIILNAALGGDVDLAQRKAIARDIDDLLRELLQEIMLFPLRQALSFAGTRNSLYRTRERVWAVSRSLIEHRLAEQSDKKKGRARDLLDAIIALDAHDIERMAAEVTAFLVAGGHTVAVALSYAVLHLCKNPHVLSKLEAEIDGVISFRSDRTKDPLSREEVLRMSYLHKVWRETLRLTPPTAAIVRRTRREVRLRGTDTWLPKGMQVNVLMLCAQTDERYFAEADQFVPERWGVGNERGEAHSAPTGAFLPFGAGQRSCAGQFLAEYEGPLVLAELLRNFRLELACDPSEICNCTGFVEVPRWSSKRDGNLDMGVPVLVTDRV